MGKILFFGGNICKSDYQGGKLTYCRVYRVVTRDLAGFD